MQFKFGSRNAALWHPHQILTEYIYTFMLCVLDNDILQENLLYNKVHFHSIVGAGIHVMDGSPPGFIPNNGLITLAGSFQSDEFSLRFFCISGSLMDEVGVLVGLDGLTISSNSFLFISRVSLPGELDVFSGGSLTTQVLGASQQGVYTCRIPDESGTMLSVNVGLYPAGFNSEYK